MKILFGLILAVVIVGCGGGSVASSPSPTTRTELSFFPLKDGEIWKFRDTSNGGTNTWVISAAPTGICGEPQFVVRMTKDRVDTYWAYGSEMSQDWYLRVDPSGQISSPLAVYYSSLDGSGPALRTFQTPQDVIVPSPLNDFSQTAQYSLASGSLLQCGGGLTPPVFWKAGVTQTGDQLTVDYKEIPQGAVSSDFEIWTFKRGVGPIRVENGDSTRHTTMERIN